MIMIIMIIIESKIQFILVSNVYKQDSSNDDDDYDHRFHNNRYYR